MNKKYNIYIPSGNPTALVIGIENNIDTRRYINDEIIYKYNGFVEQVGFVNENKNEAVLLMAGGEFCGNATRSAIYYYLDGKPGIININVLGVDLELTGGIDKENNVWVDMPIMKSNFIRKNNDNSIIVKIPGITHLVIEYSNVPKEYKNNLEEYSKIMLKKYNLTKEVAAGVMYIKREKESIYLFPYVYVKSVNTWFFETACGSGTTAVGIYESYITKNSINKDIIQPSKEIISVKVENINNKIVSATISGKVKKYPI